MTPLQRRLAASARRLITRHGEPVTLTRMPAAAAPAPYRHSAGAAVPQALRAVLRPLGADGVEGGVAEARREAFVAAAGLAITPAAGDHLAAAEGAFRVAAVETVAVAGLPIVHRLILQR